MIGFLKSVYLKNTYSHLLLTGDNLCQEFKNECPIVDFYEYKKFIIPDNITMVGFSSSIDHIAFDFEHIVWRSFLLNKFKNYKDLSKIKLYNSQELLELFELNGEQDYEEILCDVKHKSFGDYKNYCKFNILTK